MCVCVAFRCLNFPLLLQSWWGCLLVAVVEVRHPPREVGGGQAADGGRARRRRRTITRGHHHQTPGLPFLSSTSLQLEWMEGGGNCPFFFFFLNSVFFRHFSSSCLLPRQALSSLPSFLCLTLLAVPCWLVGLFCFDLGVNWRSS